MSSPQPSLDEQITEQFYRWEKRGRGWHVSPSPVAIEPPFRPFYWHSVVAGPAADDARRQTRLGALFERIRGDATQSVDGAPLGTDEEIEEPFAEPFAYPAPLVELAISLPPDCKVSRERAMQTVTRLANFRNPVSFELIGLHDSVSLQFVCAEPDRAEAREQIPAYFPEAVIRERNEFLVGAWETAGPATVIADFGLSREFMLLIRTVKDFDVDPLIPLVAALAAISQGEIGLFQVIFTAARHPWTESTTRAVSDGAGHEFFADAPDLVSQAKDKVAQPLLAVVVRVAARAETEERAWAIARNIGASLSQFADPTGNEFIPLANDDYPDTAHASDILGRVSRRSGMLLNAHELTSLAHLPSTSVRTPKFRNDRKKTGFPVIPDALRSRHVYIAGATQHGKSTFIERMALADIEQGHGICVLDPKGDLIKSIIHKIPRSRADDAILLEASNPVPIDFMGWETEQERQTLAADIFQTFLQFSTMTTGDQWLSVLRAVIYTLLDARGCSFLDINAVLVDEAERERILARVTNPDILDYWRLEYPLLKKDAPQPIITRMKQFIFSPPLKTLLGTSEAKLDIYECMETRKILLVDLSGAGKANGNLIGQLLVSKIQQSAFRRERQPRDSRIPFHLFADEFQNFQTSAFDTILSEAGGYKLCLTLANQGLYQLEPRIKDAIFTNVTGGWIVFHIDEKDVSNFKLKALPLDAQQLASLAPHTAFVKIGSESPAIFKTPSPAENQPESHADHIRKRTLDLYACTTGTRSRAYRNKPKPDDIEPRDRPPLALSASKKKRAANGR
ncbi:MAG TPA: hypothetical protein VGL53_09770 [Bryobacteraceae bacterium]|jgi:hypothetical protein